MYTTAREPSFDWRAKTMRLFHSVGAISFREVLAALTGCSPVTSASESVKRSQPELRPVPGSRPERM